ncbi:hypothetical protein FGG08_005485 [Glutinoglossum americanum]|uniref:Uncharacterized protein n=1 Tax=Glutinoglossum americanum TaxID=1670608 RepID=A0A9P8I2X8_9PEZI|nr:hypothetical protein FGG08_005485 [Glutinoglossum americanum]
MLTSKPAVVGETREPAIPLQEPQKSSTDEPALRTRSTPIRQSALDLLAAPRPHISTPASRATAKKQAEMLRIRLKLAMYKVKTNQIHVPMSELQFPSNESISSFSKPDFPATSSAPKTLSQQTQPRPNPKLLPAPVLVPTAYSARRITEPYMPSSPPCSASNSDLDAADSEADSENDFATPVAPRDRESLHPPVQLSSPPSSEKRIAITSRIYGAEGGLTSSVVKGRAANGLLELMQS